MKAPLHHKSICQLIFAILLASAGCNRSITSTPERLTLVNGLLDACLLVSSGEFEEISGLPVISETSGSVDPSFCRYVSVKDGEVVAVIYATTDTSQKMRNMADTAAESFEKTKSVDTDLAGRDPPLFGLQELSGLGDQAYLIGGPSTITVIRALKSGIVYTFYSPIVEGDGIDNDGLTKLAQLALERAP